MSETLHLWLVRIVGGIAGGLTTYYLGWPGFAALVVGMFLGAWTVVAA